MQIESLESRALLSAYFVSDSGSDTNPGSIDAPFKTITAVNAKDLLPGDTVLFEGGKSFSGTLKFDIADGGSAASPVVIGSYGVGRATILAGNADGIQAVNTAGFLISQLNVVGAGQANNSFNGISFDNRQPGNTKLQYVHIDQVDVSGFGKFGITVGGSNGKSGFNDVSITNASVHDNVVGGIETHGVFSSTATGYANTNVYVGHSVAYNNTGYAGASNHTGDGIMLSDAQNVVIERSEAHHNGANNTHVGGPVGIWVWDVDQAVIRYNESHHNQNQQHGRRWRVRLRRRGDQLRHGVQL